MEETFIIGHEADGKAYLKKVVVESEPEKKKKA